jgi:hypothetical protein
VNFPVAIFRKLFPESFFVCLEKKCSDFKMGRIKAELAVPSGSFCKERKLFCVCQDNQIGDISKFGHQKFLSAF